MVDLVPPGYASTVILNSIQDPLLSESVKISDCSPDEHRRFRLFDNVTAEKTDPESCSG